MPAGDQHLVARADRDAKAVETRLLAAFNDDDADRLRTLLGRAVAVLTSAPAAAAQQ